MRFMVIARGLVDLVAPRDCPGCEISLEDDEEGFCGGCAVLVEKAGAPWRLPAPTVAGFVFAGPLAEAIRRVLR